MGVSHTSLRVMLLASCAALLAGMAAATPETGEPIDRPGMLAEPSVTPSRARAVSTPPRSSKPALTAGKRRTASKSVSSRGGIVRKKQPPRQALYTVHTQGSGVRYRKGAVLGVGIHVIEADLSDPEVHISALLAEGGIGTAEAFASMVERARPTAAITGTFFGIKDKIPTGDLVINGKSVFRGFVGTAVAITKGNLVSFIPTGYGDRSVDWSLFHTVIRGGPRLVEGGRVVMNARSEGFRSLPLSQRKTRTGLGLTRDNRLQFVAVREPTTMWEMAKLMGAIGAYHAVALDGGTSTALYFAGRHIANPGRGLTNVLLIYHRRDHYHRMQRELAGG